MDTPSTESSQHASRDAASLIILGTFFTILSVLVFAGVAWNLGDTRAIIVTIVCGAALLAVGVGMILTGRKTARGAEKNLAQRHEDAEN